MRAVESRNGLWIGNAMNRDFVNFRALYDELTDEVSRSRHQFVADHLATWFEHLDETPDVALTILRLQAGLNFQNWYNEQLSSQGSMAGSGELNYPSAREKRLGMKLLLFREFAERRMEIDDFARVFVYTAGDLDDQTRGVIEQVFAPMARDLRRLLEREAEQAEGNIPASDRVVNLTHNSVSYQEAIDALDKLEALLRETNEYEDVEDKDQRIAEVSATKRLLQASRVRVSSVLAVIAPTVKFLAKTFATSGIGKAAGWAWDKLLALLV
jgi:hypothetical protein